MTNQWNFRMAVLSVPDLRKARLRNVKTMFFKCYFYCRTSFALSFDHNERYIGNVTLEEKEREGGHDTTIVVRNNG